MFEAQTLYLTKLLLIVTIEIGNFDISSQELRPQFTSEVAFHLLNRAQTPFMILSTECKSEYT